MTNVSIIPTEYITAQGDILKTTSLKVAQAFGKRHSHIVEKIRKLECSHSFRSANFSAHPYVNTQNGEKYTLYEMTKDGFMFLVMGFTGGHAAKIKEGYIEAFNKMASRLSSNNLVPTTMPEALRLAADLSEAVEEQKQLIEKSEPKVAVYDHLNRSDGWFCITDAGKMLGMGRKAMHQWLHSHGWIYKRAGSPVWHAYQDKIKTQYLDTRPNTFTDKYGNPRTSEQIMVTPKGLTKLARLMNVELKEAV